jgi:hypothetical protein
MNDTDLRRLVRDAVARHLGHGTYTARAAAESSAQVAAPNVTSRYPTSPWQQHASHQLYLSLVNVDGACVIEPSVACDHCGFCKSHGH